MLPPVPWINISGGNWKLISGEALSGDPSKLLLLQLIPDLTLRYLRWLAQLDDDKTRLLYRAPQVVCWMS